METFDSPSRRKYESPVLSTVLIISEFSFCAGSSRINPGGPSGSSTPGVEAWDSSGFTDEMDFDM